MHIIKTPYRKTVKNAKIKEFLNAMVAYSTPEQAIQLLVQHIAVTQYGMKKRLELYGERGIAAFRKEIQVFHDRC